MIEFEDASVLTLAPLSPLLSDIRIGNRAICDVLRERLPNFSGRWPLANWPQNDGSLLVIHYPWHILAMNEQYIGMLDHNDIRGDLDTQAHIRGHLCLGSGSVVLPGVFVEGNVIIGENCKIGPNCYLRGNTVIGDHCHIGQAVEIKNSVLGNHVSAGHLSYIGDSVIDDGVNLGAGFIVGNLRHDGMDHQSLVAGELRSTERRKFGTVIGKNVHTGIHCSVYPGRKLYPGTTTLPGEIIRTDRYLRACRGSKFNDSHGIKEGNQNQNRRHKANENRPE